MSMAFVCLTFKKRSFCRRDSEELSQTGQNGDEE